MTPFRDVAPMTDKTIDSRACIDFDRSGNSVFDGYARRLHVRGHGAYLDDKGDLLCISIWL